MEDSGVRMIERRPKLESVLARWLNIVNDRYWTERDAPWWYNESASVGSLAAAAWMNEGRALVDYRTPKYRGDTRWKGRADLWMDLGQEEYVGEAKMYWPSLSRRLGHGRTTTMLKRACADAKAHMPVEGTRRIGILIVAPWSKPLSDEKLRRATSRFHRGLGRGAQRKHRRGLGLSIPVGGGSSVERVGLPRCRNGSLRGVVKYRKVRDRVRPLASRSKARSHRCKGLWLRSQDRRRASLRSARQASRQPTHQTS